VQATTELEQSVIGAILIDPATLSLLPSLETQDFARVESRYVWNAIRNLETKGLPVDIVTVGDELGRQGVLETVGFAWLGECATKVPTVSNALEYARRIRESSLKTRLLRDLAQLIATKDDASIGGPELLTLALSTLTKFDAEQPEDSKTIGDIVKARVKQLDKIAKGETQTGYPTGIAKLDEKLGGWQPGIVTIVAARPAMGKSSLGLATADVASAAGHGVHLFSLEDTESAYADRSIARTSGVGAETIRGCNFQAGQMRDIGDAMNKLGRRKGWIVDGRSGVTADEIVRSVRRRKRENNTRIVIVDYIQLVKRPARMSPHEALSEIITTLADAAKQDNLAYVVMSQLNRELEKRDDKRPQLSDLRESGSLEERSKCVVGVYRGSVYGDPKPNIDFNPKTSKPPSKEEHERTVQLIVLKNSNGRTGPVFATWFGPTTRME
jgi:replicative DNA helicase